MGKTNWVAGGTIIAGIALLLMILIYYPQIRDNFFGGSSVTDVPFTIEISPSYFNEQAYSQYGNDILFSIVINEKTGKNITYLELSQDNFKVSRKDEGLNKPFSYVSWKSSSSDIISFGNINPIYTSYGSFPLKAEGSMIQCPNCFIGTDYPYVFTFTIYYREGSGELKTEVYNEEIPIK